MKENLKNLIEEISGDELVEKLKVLLRAENSPNCIKTNPIPINEVLDIYSFRAKMWRERQAKVAGVDELLRGLRRFDGDAIVVHKIKLSNQSFVIFTNSSETKLIGILVV